MGQVNNGTYKSGFATSQAAYDRAQRELYAALDELEARLGRHRFLVGDRRGLAVLGLGFGQGMDKMLRWYRASAWPGQPLMAGRPVPMANSYVSAFACMRADRNHHSKDIMRCDFALVAVQPLPPGMWCSWLCPHAWRHACLQRVAIQAASDTWT